MTQTDQWKNKVAIITGGSSGIGRATALSLSERGARVLITGRNETRLEELATSNPNIEYIVADSAEPDSSVKIVDAAIDLWGRLDLIVNNSGAGQPMPIDKYDASVISQMALVNIIAPSLLLKSALSELAKSKGAIVNIGTAVSRSAAPILAHYAASKAALEHLTKSWAIELAEQGIRVNAISPGPVKTGALTGMMSLPDEVAAQIEAQERTQIPLGRRGTTDDIVPWILRLGSAQNDWLTGQTITIDGGWTLRS